MLTTAACTPDGEITSTSAPAIQAVVDSAPYLCELVPKQALILVSGGSDFLTERSTGNKESGSCWAPDETPKPLQVNWLQTGSGATEEHLNFLLEGRRNIYTRHGGVNLPANLGEGMAAYLTDGLLAEQPYRVSAKFTCGGKERMIDIYLTQVAKGRDAMKDLTDLMRIAQHRYADLHNCDLK